MPSLYLCCQISPHLDFYWAFMSGSSFTISCIVNCLICKCVQWSVTLYLSPTTYMRIGGSLLWTHETSTLGWTVELKCVLSSSRLEAATCVALVRLKTSKPLPHPTAEYFICFVLCSFALAGAFHLRGDTPRFLCISTMYIKFQYSKEILKLGCN